MIKNRTHPDLCCDPPHPSNCDGACVRPATSPQASSAAMALNPWQPMTSPIDLKHLGKLAEELNEAGAAVARCIIQGIAEREPVTGKMNKQWLEDELADVAANLDLVAAHFGLDREYMAARAARKQAHLRAWHSMLGDKPSR
jgi:hypothetical protein